MMPRKFRNKEERTIICDEVKNEILKLQLDLDSEPLQRLLNVLNSFVSNDAGALFDGVILLSDINKQIEYYLPGRRMERPYIRLVKIPI